MTAEFTLHYADGTKQTIPLENVVELNLSTDKKRSLCFNETNSGKWVMTVASHLLIGKLADNFLTAEKKA